MTDRVYKVALFLDAGSAIYSQLLYDLNPLPIGNFNGDEFDDVFDIVSSVVVSGTVSGLSGTTVLSNLKESTSVSAVHDINGDGKDDLLNLYTNIGEGFRGLQFILGGTAQFVEVDSIFPGEFYSSSISYSFLSADFDKDNAFEILAYTTSSGNDLNFILEYDQSNNNLVITDTLRISGAPWNGLSDLNGDTFPDLWDAVSDESGQWDVLVHFGTASSPYFSESSVTITVGATQSLFVSIGDVNNDGADDLLGRDDDNNAVLYLGGASVASGFTTQTLQWGANEAASPITIGADGPGDINGDGFSDILLNYANFDSRGRFNEIGTAIVQGGAIVSTSNAPKITQNYEESAATLNYGFETVNFGDINGDGYDDWGIMAMTGGYVDIFFGGLNLDMTVDVKIKLSLDGPTHAIEGGDINGDGFSDVLVSRINSTPANSRVLIYLGKTNWSALLYEGDADVVISSPSDMNGFGYQVNTVGDFNADGYTDFVVSGVQYETADSLFKREAYLYYGGTTISTTPSLTLATEDIFNNKPNLVRIGGPYYKSTTRQSSWTFFDNHLYPAAFGKRISALGDVNGDGYDDFALSDKLHPDGFLAGPNGGRVLVYYGGPDADNAYDVEIPASGASVWGFAMATNGGDYDGDGYNDIAIAPVILSSATLIEIYRGGTRTGLFRILYC